jgi:hypothetical protein
MKTFAAIALLGLATALKIKEGPTGTEGPATGGKPEHGDHGPHHDEDGTVDTTDIEEATAEEMDWMNENLPGWEDFSEDDWMNVNWDELEGMDYGMDTTGDYGDYGMDTYGHDDHHDDHHHDDDYGYYGEYYGYGDDYYGDDYYGDHDYGYGDDGECDCFMTCLGGSLYEHGLIGDAEVEMWMNMDEDEQHAMGTWAFGKVDTDGSDTLSMEEGIAGIRHLFGDALGDVSDEEIAGEISSAVGHFDHNDDGELSWTEITGEEEHHEAEEEWDGENHDEDCFMGCLAEKLWEHDLIDQDDIDMWTAMDGETQAELGAYIFGEVDADGSGDIDMEEGVGAIRFMFPELEASDEEIAAELSDAVGHFDTDGSASLTWGEITGDYGDEEVETTD